MTNGRSFPEVFHRLPHSTETASARLTSGAFGPRPTCLSPTRGDSSGHAHANQEQIIDAFPPDLELSEIVANLLTLVMAFVLALPIGWNRERSRQSLGFRTFPLVAVSAAAYMLVGMSFIEGGDAFARLIQGLMTGIGFLGGGAIVKTGMNIQGLSTAASIWATAALGAAVATGRFEIAVVIALVTFGTLALLPEVGKRVDEEVSGDAEPAEDAGE